MGTSAGNVRKWGTYVQVTGSSYTLLSYSYIQQYYYYHIKVSSSLLKLLLLPLRFGPLQFNTPGILLLLVLMLFW
jgi:hypothetical protein